MPEVIHPVVIVPGFIGCWPPQNNNKSKLDPITHVYDGLWEALCRAGYVPNVSLFGFGYDWRRSLEESSRELAKRLNEITAKSPKNPSAIKIDYSKVNIIAHSYGGLVSRAYVQSDFYSDDVAKLFCVATPHYGTTAAYYGMADGDSTKIGIPRESSETMLYIAHLHDKGNIISWIIGIINLLRKQIKVDLYEEFNKIPAIQDLLPIKSTNYLFSEVNGQEKLYPFGATPGYPVNHTLEKLNSPEYLERLDRLEELSLFFALSHPTQSRIQIDENKGERGWQYGKALEPQPAKCYSPGDTLVPAESADIDFMPYKRNGTLWKVRCNVFNMHEKLNRPINHIEIVGDPECARFIVNQLHKTKEITPELWTAPKLSERKTTFSALFF